MGYGPNGRPDREEKLALVKELAAQGLNAHQIQKKIAVPAPTIRAWCKAAGIKLVNGLAFEHVETIRLEYNTGDSASVVGRRNGISRAAVLGIWNRADLRRTPGGGVGKNIVPGKNTSEPYGQLPVVKDTPSQAMINLAKFDPVIDRALRQRRGEPIGYIDLRRGMQDPIDHKKRGGDW